MADAPDKLTVSRNRDQRGRAWYPWVRRSILAVLGVAPVLGLLNVFGQRPATALANTPAASLKVYAPTKLRGGLLFMARFTVTAHQDIKKAVLVLDTGWAESITINTIEPSPVSEASSHGKLSFELGHIPAGGVYRLFMEFQVNPTNVGSRTQDVALYDGNTRLIDIDRSTFVWP